MSFMYPRTITIKRPAEQAGVGGLPGYAADTTEAEVTIATGIPANIQAKNARGKNPVGLPGDGAANIWKVMTPRGALADGQVVDRDVIYDDLGRKFQVIADYSNSLGGAYLADRLEA